MTVLMSEAPTQFVRLTPCGQGAVAVVAVQGPRATELLTKCFQPNSGRSAAELPFEQIVLGKWGGSQGEELIVCRRAENYIEIQPHGGQATIAHIVDCLARLGAVEHAWETWLAAHENCPISAVARTLLARAATRKTAAILLDQYHGALQRDWREVIDLLRENDVASARSKLAWLDSYCRIGLHLIHPWKVVLAGLPNVGKSSLLNTLVGFQRVIVLDQPGTTRDVVVTHTAIDGWPVELSDTAGLHDGGDPLEAESVELAKQAAADADLVIIVLDGTLSEDELRKGFDDVMVGGVGSSPGLVERDGVLLVANKVDIIAASTRSRLERLFGEGLQLTSALTREGIDGVLEALLQRLVGQPPPPGVGVPFTASLCRRNRQALHSLDTGQAPVVVMQLLAEMLFAPPAESAT